MPTGVVVVGVGVEFRRDQPRQRTRPSLPSTWSTVEGDRTVRGRTHSTSRPAPASRSRSWAEEKQRVMLPSGQAHQHDLAGLAQVGPVVLLGQNRHSEHERVDADQHPPARFEHPRHVGQRRLGHDLDRQRARSSATTASTLSSARKARSSLRHLVDEVGGLAEPRLGGGTAEVEHLDHPVADPRRLGGPAAPAPERSSSRKVSPAASGGAARRRRRGKKVQ